MITQLRVLLQRPGYRYLVVGGSVYGLELAVIVIAQLLGAGPVLAVAISFVTGTIVSFFLQKLVVFSDKRMHHRILVPQLIAGCLLVLFNFGFTVLVTQLLSPPLPAIATRTLALAITVTWNFYLYKMRIFKTDQDNPIY